MKLVLFHIVCALFTNVSIANAGNVQEYDTDYRTKNMMIQRLVKDVLGKTVTLNFKISEAQTGTLVRANGTEFALQVDSAEEIFQTETIYSFTAHSGITEGILVLLTSAFTAGFGLGAATLSFDGISSNVLIGVAVVFGFFGGWLGYDSFFQEVEIVLP